MDSSVGTWWVRDAASSRPIRDVDSMVRLNETVTKKGGLSRLSRGELQRAAACDGRH